MSMFQQVKNDMEYNKANWFGKILINILASLSFLIIPTAILLEFIGIVLALLYFTIEDIIIRLIYKKGE